MSDRPGNDTFCCCIKEEKKKKGKWCSGGSDVIMTLIKKTRNETVFSTWLAFIRG